MEADSLFHGELNFDYGPFYYCGNYPLSVGTFL